MHSLGFHMFCNNYYSVKFYKIVRDWLCLAGVCKVTGRRIVYG